MHFELNEDQKLLQQTVRDWARAKVAPIAAELDQEHRYPAELVEDMAQMGLMGIMVPAEWDGAGMDTISYAVAMEEISKACASTAVIMSAHMSLVCGAIAKYGTDAQKDHWLRPLARGERLGCFALSEPGTGSDAANQTCTATRDGDDFVIEGTKNWITNGPTADTCLLIAMTDRSQGVKGITAFLVDMGRDGVSRGKPEDKMGIRASGTCSLIFEGYRAKADEVLGEVGKGFKVAMSTLDGGRIGIAAQAVGIAQAAFEAASAYALERKAFGKPIGALQAIQHKIADMATEIDAARLLVLRAAWMKDSGQRFSKQSAMAKLYASEMAARVCHQAVQVHGGYGYVKEYDVERYYRDQRITEIYEGTSEIQRLVIARAVLDEAAAKA